MDFRNKNDVYGTGQRRVGIGNLGGSGSGPGAAFYAPNFGNDGGGISYNNSNNLQLDRGNSQLFGNRSPEMGGNFGRSRPSNDNNFPYNDNNRQRDLEMISRETAGSNSYLRGLENRSNFNSNNQNQRYSNSNDNFGDSQPRRDFDDNFRGGGGGGPSGDLGNARDLPSNFGNFGGHNDSPSFANRNSVSSNFNSDFRNLDNNNYRGPQSSTSFGDNNGRYYNDAPRNQNRSSNVGLSDDVANFNDNYRGGSRSQNFADQRPNYNDGDRNSYGGGGGGGFNDNFRGNNYGNSGSGNVDNCGPSGSSFNNNIGINNAGPSVGNFGQNNSRNFQPQNDRRNYNDGISRSWNNSNTQQSSSFQDSGYQSVGSGNGNGNGNGNLSAWEASQRAYNSKRIQNSPKKNLNNGGVIRKPAPAPAIKNIQGIRNNPKTVALITANAARNPAVRNPVGAAGNPRIAGGGPGANPRNVGGGPVGNPRNALGPGPNARNAVARISGTLQNRPNQNQNNAARNQIKPKIIGPNQRKPNNVGPNQPRANNAAGNASRNPQPARAKNAVPAPTAGQPKAKPPVVNNAQPKGQTVAGGAPRPGQKRAAPAAVAPAAAVSSPLSKSERKWLKVARKRGFLMGGFKLPYLLNGDPKKLPQFEDESYAVAFFEQTFIYSTNPYAGEEEFTEAAVVINDDSDDEELKAARKIHKRTRKRLRTDLVAVHQSTSTMDWPSWWKDHKALGEEIDKQLKACGNLNLEHSFLPNFPKLTTEQVIDAVIKSAHFGLEKNADVPFDTMKTIFTLMNLTFLENLTDANKEEVQNIIRNIPNALWVRKMRSMINLWAKYKHVAEPSTATEAEAKEEHNRLQQATAREWKSACFHWVAKQAFDELVSISAAEWKDHATLFPKQD